MTILAPASRQYPGRDDRLQSLGAKKTMATLGKLWQHLAKCVAVEAPALEQRLTFGVVPFHPEQVFRPDSSLMAPV